MKPKVQALGGPIARECRDGGQVKLSTFILLKIRRRGASKVVVRPNGQVESPGKVASQIDQPLLAGGADADLLLAATARRRRGRQWERDRPARRLAPLDGQ